MNQEEILLSIRKDLKSKVDQEYKEGSYRYFKEQIKPIGVRGSDVKIIIRKYFILLEKQWKFEDFVRFSEKLLKGGWMEEVSIAFHFIENLKKQFKEETFYLFEKWLNDYVHNWAHCDEISVHLIGEVVDKHPKLINNLKEWTKSKNRWLRRSSAVSLIMPARHGKYLKEIFEISEKLMMDKDDMVQKGVGWLLKEASKKHEKDIVRFLLRSKNKTSRLVLRYATEKMSVSNRRLVLR